MQIGTKSLLFGVHQIFLHPLFVLRAWVMLYGWPRDWRIYLAIFIHDWGYWGKPEMDGPEGTRHPVWAADKMSRWFGPQWWDFMIYHSRTLARRNGARPSQLCFPDKLSIASYPNWLYQILGRASGEIWEYMEHAKLTAPTSASLTKWEAGMMASGWPSAWKAGVSAFMKRWVEEHKDDWKEGRRAA